MNVKTCEYYSSSSNTPSKRNKCKNSLIYDSYSYTNKDTGDTETGYAYYPCKVVKNTRGRGKVLLVQICLTRSIVLAIYLIIIIVYLITILVAQQHIHSNKSLIKNHSK